MNVDVLAVVAHPDDESIFCSGALLASKNNGFSFGVVCLTDGRNGRTLGLVRKKDLARIRAAELSVAIGILGASYSEVISIPDYSGCGSSCIQHAESRLTAILKALTPRVVLSFPENGVNGHPDHCATYKLVRQICAPDQILSFVYPPVELPHRVGYLSPEELRSSYASPNYVLEMGSLWHTKLKAMASYETQALNILRAVSRYPNLLTQEAYIAPNAMNLANIVKI